MKALLGNNDASPTAGVFGTQYPRAEQTATNGTPLVEDALVLRAGQTRGHLRALNLRQALTAFGPAVSKNLASALRRHASAETDFPLPLDFRGLPSHLHCCCFLPLSKTGL